MRVIVRYGDAASVQPTASRPLRVPGSPPEGNRNESKQSVVVITIRPPSEEGRLQGDAPAGIGSERRRRLEGAAREMRLRDAEVRAHEQAHLSALGAYAAGPVTYGYATGPNGEAYAVSGSIKVDLAPVPGDPEATLRKARAIITAALAPGEPSGPDMRVAAQAYLLESKARDQIEAERSTGGTERIDLNA
ncbi:putative metalloprotease CJM1_0395 family protein [Salinispira pacifica]